MSLTAILKANASALAAVERKVADTLVWSRTNDILVKPAFSLQRGDWGLVGTAFDFWLRAHLIVKHGAVETRTVLDSVVDLSRQGHFGANPKARISDDEREYLPDAIARISAERKSAIAAKRINDSGFLWNCITAARLEGYYRNGRCSAAPIGDVYGDLEKLTRVALRNDNLFRASRYELNLQFPTYASLLGGADADFGMDDIIVDIKCTKQLYPVGVGGQLLGYALLSALEARQQNTKTQYKRIGIYNARFGMMGTAAIKDLLPELQTVQNLLGNATAKSA